MAKHFASFETEEAYNSAVNDAVNAALAEQKAAHDLELAALRSALEKAQSSAGADYSAYEKYPDLVALIKASDMRPQGLPAICALHIWNGLNLASDISKAIGRTPKLGEKGDVECTTKIASGALQKLEKALLTANTGVGVKVTSLRGKDGDASVKKIRFAPMVFEDDAPETTPQTDDAAAQSEEKAAA